MANEAEYVNLDSVMNSMEEESKKGGNFFKMEPNDQRTVEIISDPVQATRTFDENTNSNANANANSNSNANKGPRTVFRFKILEAGSQDEKTWEVGNRQLMQQFVAIQRRYSLKTWKGAKMIVSTAGKTNIDKKWSLVLICAQGYQNPAFMAPATAQGAPAPDAGEQWINGQMQGVKQ